MDLQKLVKLIWTGYKSAGGTMPWQAADHEQFVTALQDATTITVLMNMDGWISGLDFTDTYFIHMWLFFSKNTWMCYLVFNFKIFTNISCDSMIAEYILHIMRSLSHSFKVACNKIFKELTALMYFVPCLKVHTFKQSWALKTDTMYFPSTRWWPWWPTAKCSCGVCLVW